MIKKTIASILAIAIMAIMGETGFAQGNPQELLKPEQLSLYSQNNNINIVIYDNDDNVSQEYHSDGLVVNYRVDNNTKEICEVSNSNGIKMKIASDNNEKIFTTFDANNEIVKVETLKIESSKFRSDDISIDNIKKATLLGDTPANTSELRGVYSDHIQGGYNLSNMIPSVWTAETGSDKFGRPSTAMSLSDIQSYLEAKNSVLKNPIVVWAYNSNGSLYNTGKTATPSEVVNDASETYWINPKVLLGKLQGESSLVYTQSANVNTRAFAFCMGYNTTDTGDIYSGTGFDSQVDNAARVLLHHWNTAYNMGMSKMPYYFDNLDTDIYVDNCGTFALYTYTPWLKSNLLLAKVFKMMFPGNGQNGVDWS